MEKRILRGRILKELKSLISHSCRRRNAWLNAQKVHQLLIKKHYNAADVTIDYHRKRITMDVVLDDTHYDPGQLNINLPTLRVNLLFHNLSDFLNSGIQTDSKSLAFYAWLVHTFEKKEVPLLTA